jgi:ribosomal protein S18 acetylase RimI-like enzyme
VWKIKVKNNGERISKSGIYRGWALMLDKSIPYFNIIMKRPAGASLPHYGLPVGFSFEWYISGMEVDWAAIEASVGEFDNNKESLNFFKNEYLSHSEELKNRLLFVLNQERKPVGTITGWWNFTGERRNLSIHWFAVQKEYQGLGIGKALVTECIRNLQVLEGDKDIYLHTQTWSYKAIALYLKSGFNIEVKETFSHYKNDYEQALPILQELLNNKLR